MYFTNNNKHNSTDVICCGKSEFSDSFTWTHNPIFFWIWTLASTHLLQMVSESILDRTSAASHVQWRYIEVQQMLKLAQNLKMWLNYRHYSGYYIHTQTNFSEFGCLIGKCRWITSRLALITTFPDLSTLICLIYYI